ncbi:TaqI-like C-terminal specificity domain-containing protein, partial [Acidithiobacillus sp.]|uniref:TaqI-like C-terminal specificity domain-containing protein n=1 Tax=Acidithiobacillus sp. TaxID=1872118 RepID=UPI003D08A665
KGRLKNGRRDIYLDRRRPTTSRFVRTSTTTFLLANERVILNREYFSRTPKLIWRQTASCLIATVDDKGVWFWRSIQGATVRHNFRHLDLYFLAGVLNSAYLRYVYNRRVQEQGRIFPQVKFDNIKPMPLVVVAKSEQKKIIQLVREAVSAKRTNPVVDISDLESQIDLEVYRLYGLTPEEIKNVEESAPLDKPRKQTTQEIDSNP